MLTLGNFEKAVGELLKEHGWYSNDGWRRNADARAHGAMPPALSAGEAVNEIIGQERAFIAAAEKLRIRVHDLKRTTTDLKRTTTCFCGEDLWTRGDEIVCINFPNCDHAVQLRPGEVAR